MYLDKLDGKVTETFFNEEAGAWRDQQQTSQRKIEEVGTAGHAPINHAVDLVTLTSESCDRFLAQIQAEQRRLLTMLLETCLLERWVASMSLWSNPSNNCAARTP